MLTLMDTASGGIVEWISEWCINGERINTTIKYFYDSAQPRTGLLIHCSFMINITPSVRLKDSSRLIADGDAMQHAVRIGHALLQSVQICNALMSCGLQQRSACATLWCVRRCDRNKRATNIVAR